MKYTFDVLRDLWLAEEPSSHNEMIELQSLGIVQSLLNTNFPFPIQQLRLADLSIQPYLVSWICLDVALQILTDLPCLRE